MSVTTTNFAANMKIVYGTIQDQISTEPAFMNLLGDGSKFGQPINNLGSKGYVFEARLRPNFYMGFRPESATSGVGTSGNQGLENSTVLLKYGYVPEVITGQADTLSKGDARAFMQAKALQLKNDIKDFVSHCNVVAVGAERGGQLAQVASSPAPTSTVFYADNAGYLPGALYLRVGMPVDTNAVAGGALTVSSELITAINYATRAVTKTTTTATWAAGEAVTLGGEAALTAGTFPYTMEGLNSLVSDSGSIQGLNPATAGQESWKSFVWDAVGDDLTSSAMQMLRQFVKNRGGMNPDIFVFPSAQISQLVKFATQNYRFETNGGKAIGKKALDIGYDVFEYAGLPIIEDKDGRPDRIFCGASETMKKFEALPLQLLDNEAGAWTRVQTTTGLADAVAALLGTYLNIGTTQRSAWGMIKGLNADAVWYQNPQTI
jgi:hypothetical protein